MKHFPESEFIINADGSVFHLHLQPEQLRDKIILVGDPGRVDLVASFSIHVNLKFRAESFTRLVVLTRVNR